MTVVRVRRPTWRSFRPEFEERACAFVRRGGHAAIARPNRVDALLGTDASGRITELGRWALLSIGVTRHEMVCAGPAAGLARARVPADYEGAVLDWCARDAAFRGATHVVLLDCLACAACCHDSRVEISRRDAARFRRAERAELLATPFVRRDASGKLHLPMRASGACVHLTGERACSIYPIRPDGCRAFVAGSEPCLAARHETLGLRDGLA